MELYLIKSAACLAILLVFYKIFLEKESFHIFKRFYLLVALLVAFGIPLLTFTYYVEATPMNFSTATIDNPVIAEEINIFNWFAIIWTIYGLGVLFFGIRFLLNLSRIVQRIQSNPQTKRQSFINVLLNDLVIPHTFFNYIFLNKSKFEQQEIPEEVLLHEQTHAKQRHSIDILLIEIFQVVFWFNPLLYLLKNTIKLNHEFLADQAVMNNGINLTTYQQLILSFSLNPAEPQLASAINYSSIKKRFTIMKTRTTQKTTWIKSFILLPLLAVMVYGFSDNEEIIQNKDIVEQVKNELEEAGHLKINYDNQQKTATREQMAEYNKLAKHYNTALKDDNGISIKLKDVKRLKLIYSIMSEKQRQDAEPFPDFPKPPPPPNSPDAPKVYKKDMIPPPPPIPPNATPAQKAKYEKVIANYKKNEMVPPPPPPKAPPTMEELAEKGAIFYSDGKRISSKEAIEIVNKNKDIKFHVLNVDSKQPTVKLSKKGITVKRKN